jgi:hypothetical protein
MMRYQIQCFSPWSCQKFICPLKSDLEDPVKSKKKLSYCPILSMLNADIKEVSDLWTPPES